MILRSFDRTALAGGAPAAWAAFGKRSIEIARGLVPSKTSRSFQRCPAAGPCWQNHRVTLLTLGLLACASSSLAQTSDTNLVWRDARELMVEGRGWRDTKDFYNRLPARAEKMVRQNV